MTFSFNVFLNFGVIFSFSLNCWYTVFSAVTFNFNVCLNFGVSIYYQVLDVGCGIGGPLREISRFR